MPADPAYLPYPRFLLKMEISQTAKLLYSLLLDRSTLSQKNKWLDDEGRIYIIYPIAEIAEKMCIRDRCITMLYASRPTRRALMASMSQISIVGKARPFTCLLYTSSKASASWDSTICNSSHVLTHLIRLEGRHIL